MTRRENRITRTADLDPFGRVLRRACYGTAATIVALLALAHCGTRSLDPALPPCPHPITTNAGRCQP